MPFPPRCLSRYQAKFQASFCWSRLIATFFQDPRLSEPRRLMVARSLPNHKAHVFDYKVLPNRLPIGSRVAFTKARVFFSHPCKTRTATRITNTFIRETVQEKESFSGPCARLSRQLSSSHPSSPAVRTYLASPLYVPAPVTYTPHDGA